MKRKLIYERIHPDAKRPTKAHKDDACWDLYAINDPHYFVAIQPNTTEAIRTGLRFEILPGEKLHVYSRSGLANNNVVCVFNAPGVIDTGYVGELAVILYNGGTEPFFVTPGMKIAQFAREIVLDDELAEGVVDMNTDRGEKGFGSSGL